MLPPTRPTLLWEMQLVLLTDCNLKGIHSATLHNYPFDIHQIHQCSHFFKESTQP